MVLEQLPSGPLGDGGTQSAAYGETHIFTTHRRMMPEVQSNGKTKQLDAAEKAQIIKWMFGTGDAGFQEERSTTGVWTALSSLPSATASFQPSVPFSLQVLSLSQECK